MRFPGFIGPSYTLQSVNADCQRSVNLYPELNEVGTGKEKEIAALVGTPGLRLLATVGNGPIRGAWYASNEALYVVSGNTVYYVDSAWTATSLGTLNTSTGYVSMADNGIQLMMVDGSYAYYVTLLTNIFTAITDPDFPGATTVTFQDEYFIFNKPGTGQFFISGLNDVSFDSLDISTAEGLADNLVGVLSDQRNLYLLGTQSTEVFYDSGASAFPFERIQGAFIPIGCSAAFSIAKLQGAVYWLGKDEHGNGIVYRAQGYQPQRISTHAIERVFASISDLSQAKAWTYQQGGHGFYCLSIPTAETTWVFDTTTNLWHERAQLAQGVLARHRADCHVYAYNTNVVGDYETGKIYALDPAKYTDNGSYIPWIRTAPHISQSLKRLFCSQFQLDMETGVGLDGSGQGIDPQVILDWSDDGGHTWSNEHWQSAGAIGTTKTRVIWRRLGSFRDRVFRVRGTDPVKRTLLGVDLLIEEGTA